MARCLWTNENVHMPKVKPHPKPPKMRQFFRAWRKYRGYTQEELAEMVGVTASAISQLETGKQGFMDSTLASLAEALQCEPADLLIRNPLDEDAPWSLWDQVKNAPTQKRRDIVAVVQTMLRTGTDD